MMNASPFQVDLTRHGEHCSDLSCPLPVCINWKLGRGVMSNQITSKPKRNRLSSNDCSQEFKWPHICEEFGFFNTRTHSTDSQDDEMFRHEQLLKVKDVEDLQTYFQDPAIFSNQVRNLEPLHAVSNPPLEIQLPQTKKPALKIFSQMSTALEVPTDKSMAHYMGTDSLELDPGEFIPMDPYVSLKSTKNCTIGKRLQNGDSNDVDGSLRGLKVNKVGHHDKKSRSVEKPNNLFRVLSEIMRMFELPMSRDLEASYCQVLEMALAEIRRQRLKCDDKRNPPKNSL